MCGPTSQACSLVSVICYCVTNNPERSGLKQFCSVGSLGSSHLRCLVKLQSDVSRLWHHLKASSLPHLVTGLGWCDSWGLVGHLSSPRGCLGFLSAGRSQDSPTFTCGCLPSQQECQETGSGSSQPLKTKTLKLPQSHFHYWISSQSCSDTRGGPEGQVPKNLWSLLILHVLQPGPKGFLHSWPLSQSDLIMSCFVFM